MATSESTESLDERFSREAELDARIDELYTAIIPDYAQPINSDAFSSVYRKWVAFYEQLEMMKHRAKVMVEEDETPPNLLLHCAGEFGRTGQWPAGLPPTDVAVDALVSSSEFGLTFKDSGIVDGILDLVRGSAREFVSPWNSDFSEIEGEVETA